MPPDIYTHNQQTASSDLSDPELQHTLRLLQAAQQQPSHVDPALVPQGTSLVDLLHARTDQLALIVGSGVQTETRQLACITLKNAMLKRIDSLPPAQTQFACNALMQVLDGPIRRIAASALAGVFAHDPERWPELLPALLNLTNIPSTTQEVSGAWYCLELICQDAAE